MAAHSSILAWRIPWTEEPGRIRSMGFSGQEYWSGLPCPPPGDCPDPGMEPMSLMSPVLAGRLTTSTTWEAPFLTARRTYSLKTHCPCSRQRNDATLLGGGY